MPTDYAQEGFPTGPVLSLALNLVVPHGRSLAQNSSYQQSQPEQDVLDEPQLFSLDRICHDFERINANQNEMTGNM